MMHLAKLKYASVLFLSITFLIYSCEEELTEQFNDYYSLSLTFTNGQVRLILGNDTLNIQDEYSFPAGTEVKLLAIPETNFEFNSWSGSVSSVENPVTISMDENKSIRANFGEDQDPPYEAGDKKTFSIGSNEIIMIYCPGGSFKSNLDDSDGDFEDGPEVSCDPFWISETEVTNKLAVEAFHLMNGFKINPDGGSMVSGDGIFNPENEDAHNYVSEDVVKWGGEDLMYMGELLGTKYDIYYSGSFKVYDQRDNQPVKNISWFGCIMICNQLSDEIFGKSSRVYDGIDTTWLDDETIETRRNTGFRLPTGIEWECAAKWQGNDDSGDAYEWPEGSGKYWTRGSHASGALVPTSEIEATAAVSVFRYNDGFKDNPKETDVVKGDRQSNFLGIFDMSGNVEEWCWDESGNGSGRLIRGGGFVSQHYYLRIGEPPYGGMWAGGMGSDLGFRLVMSTED